ncbi:MAG: MltA domain-containing protein [Phycisphaeraceae bacterium]|nr:MltA domain-containing protein [Phycisphaeraceae bacterium]
MPTPMTTVSWFKASIILVLAGLLSFSAAGCQQTKEVVAPPPPEYARELPPGAAALRKLDPANWPDLTASWTPGDQALLAALDRSAKWFEYPSAHSFFPVQEITYEQARQSVPAFRKALTESTSAAAFVDRLKQNFDLYTSVGWNGNGAVLFTGYYTPIFDASPVRTEAFQYPLYARPDDLVTDPDGKVLGRRVGDRLEPYPTRAQLMQSGVLTGKEIAWLGNPFDVYLAQVQGSARLTMTDGNTMHLGYAGTNGHDYASISMMLAKQGKIDKHRITLSAVRNYFKQHPDELDTYVSRNPRFTFFKAYDPANWPAGSLGFQVTPRRSLATDKRIFPRGGTTLIALPGAGSADPQHHGGKRMYWLLDQDTGGAIRAPGRADIYFGVGPDAEVSAGNTMVEGRLYYLFVKPTMASAPVMPLPVTPATTATSGVTQ